MVAFPPVVPGDDIEVSATSYVTFLRCPEQAAARYRGEYGPDSRAGFAGQLAHRIFARHLDSGPIGGREAFDLACREEIGAGLNPKIGSLGLKPSELRGVIEETAALYERFKALDFDGFAGSEVTVTVVPTPGVTLKGSIDAVFDDATGWRLVDWKTGGMSLDTTHQLAFYALLWALDRGSPPGRVEAISVRTGERQDGSPGQRSVSATAESVADMVSTLRRSWGDASVLERRGGPWCRYCPVLESCEEGSAAVVTAT